MADAELSIRCEALRKTYDDDEIIAVAGLDLEVRMGECFGLLGPNGAGKTTTCEILEGLLPATSGTVGRILGRRWETHERWLRERLGVSLQQTHLPDKLTVRETVQLFRSFFTNGRAVDATIDLVALREKEQREVRHAGVGRAAPAPRRRVRASSAIRSSSSSTSRRRGSIRSRDACSGTSF